MKTVDVKVVAPKVSDNKVELKFLVEGEINDWEWIFDLMRKRGQMTKLSFGSPQLEMSFYRESTNRGLVATVDQSGVVQSAKREDDREEDEDQAELFGQDGDEPAAEDPEGTDEEAGENPEPNEEEVDFDDGDAAENVDESEEGGAEETGDDAAELDAEEIEAYILAEEPAFDQIPFNFPEMIRRVRAKEARWMDLSKESGIPSTRLQAIYRKYKELVVEKMRAQGVA